MCGIAGIIGRPQRREIVKILLELQERGTDATGVGLNCRAEYKVLKAGIDASTACQIDAFKRGLTHFCKTANIALLHTRLATHGSAQDNNNNHPIHNKKGVMIHNGVVFVPSYYETVGQTDTEEMLESIAALGMEEAIKQASGSFAIAYQAYENRQVVYLYSHVSPLVIGRRHGNIYFCSTAEILKKAIGKFKHYDTKEHHLYKVDASTMQITDLGEILPKRSSWLYGGGDLDWLSDYSGHRQIYGRIGGHYMTAVDDNGEAQLVWISDEADQARRKYQREYTVWSPDLSNSLCRDCVAWYEEHDAEPSDDCAGCPYSLPLVETLSDQSTYLDEDSCVGCVEVDCTKCPVARIKYKEILEREDGADIPSTTAQVKALKRDYRNRQRVFAEECTEEDLGFNTEVYQC